MISFSRAWSRRIAFTESSLSAEVREARRLSLGLDLEVRATGRVLDERHGKAACFDEKRRPFRLEYAPTARRGLFGEVEVFDIGGDVAEGLIEFGSGRSLIEVLDV